MEVSVRRNSRYEILTPNGWSDFNGIQKVNKENKLTIETKNNTLSCSITHPIFIDDENVINANNLKIGDKILTKQGLEEVSSIVIEAGLFDFYDPINVDHKNQYYSDDILSHNCMEFQGSSGTLIAGWRLKQLTHSTPLNENDAFTIYKAPLKNRAYMVIADTSHGKGLDYSAAQVIDISEMPYEQVAVFHSNTTVPYDFAEILNRICRNYNMASLLCENNDLGTQVVDALHHDFEYEGILYTENAGKMGKRITAGGKTASERGVKTTKPVKGNGCSLLKLLIEQQQLFIADFNTIGELSVFSKKGQSYEAEEGNHDDLVMCLPRNTIVVTEDGNKKIKWIVDNKYTGKVLSVDENNIFVWKNIIGHSSRINYLKNGTKKKWVSLKHFNGRNRKFLVCTEDHKCAYIHNVINPEKIDYIRADQLIGKYTIRNPINGKENRLYNSEQVSIAIGIMLGDGSISKNGTFSTAHGEKQNNYSVFIHNILHGHLYYNKKNQSTVQFPVNAQTHLLRELFYNNNNKKTLKNIIHLIDEKSLAFWYMDDGYYKMSNNCINASIEMCTECFDYDDHLLLKTHLLNKFNINSHIQKMKINKKDVYRLRIGTKDSKIFFNLVAPYFCDVMKYKLPIELHNIENYKFNNEPLTYAALKITDIEYLPDDDAHQSMLYDIEVEDTHNFIANDTLVHNCLVLFAWAADQQYFKDLTDINTLYRLRERGELEMDEYMLPFGFIDDGRTPLTQSEEVIDLIKNPEYRWLFGDDLINF